tara:strand:+ start:4281 stop:5450 length:1170 start_codon:yes stop_codon:yes gene_type:complete
MVKIISRENRQLVLVIAIIVGAIVLSRMLGATRTLPQAISNSVGLPVTATELKKGAYPVQIRSTGRVIPRGTVSITPQVSGRVVWVSDHLFGGGYLVRNEVLFRVEAADYENDVARERAAVAKAQTDLALERAEADAAVAEWRGLNPAVEPPPLVSRVPQIAQADAEVAAAKARLAQAELNLSRTHYRLPFDGRVIASTLEPGAYILAGQSYGEIYNQDSLEIVLSLAQADLPWLRRPDEVDVDIINFNAPDGESGVESDRKSIGGKILRMGAILDDATRFQQVVIKPVGDGNLLPGMLVEVVLRSSPVADTWKVPASAVQSGQVIWQVDESATLRRVEPQIIATLSDSVIVRLPVNTDSVLVVDAPISGVIDGAKVVVLDSQDKPRRE